MDGRRLTAVLLLMVAVAVGFITAPALSGEHPWDSDRTDGGGRGAGGATLHYDTIRVPDTTVVIGTLLSSSAGTSVWVVILTAAWSASWSM